MKRVLRFGIEAALGSTLLTGCASTPAVHQPRVADATPARTEPGPEAAASIAPAQPASYIALAPPITGDLVPLFEPESPADAVPPAPVTAEPNATPLPIEPPQPIEPAPAEAMSGEQPSPSAVPINLPTALAMIDGQHPVVGFARWRVQEAYAELDQAKVLWLPSIQTGFNFRRRDGNYQAVDGSIVDVNLNSMNYGLGSGAVAAGSPTRPGVVAEFHLADAIFLPKAAELTAWARGHAASATLNQQLLDSGLAYIDLLEAYQDQEIVAEAVLRTSDLATLTANFAEAGAGQQSDSDRTATELALLQTRQLAVRERQLVASTRLARVLSIPMTSTILPQDSVAVPLDLFPQASDEPTLIATGLATRPELKESQTLVAAACEAFRREKYAPFVPSVLLGFSTTRFGGGLGNDAENFAGRYDVDAMMVWELRNLGLGEGAARRERNSQVQQANFVKLRLMDQVAQEVAEAHAQVEIRKQQVDLAQTAIGRARDSYQRNIDRIRDGQGLPIEALQAIQALETAQRAYLRAVIDFNRAQLQLQWALGWPVTSPDSPQTPAPLG